MTSVEEEARLAVLNRIHGLAAFLLGFDCVNDDATDWFGALVRRWAQRCKWRLVDGFDPDRYEVWLATQHAIDRFLHPERELEKRGFVLPGLIVAR